MRAKCKYRIPRYKENREIFWPVCGDLKRPGKQPVPFTALDLEYGTCNAICCHGKRLGIPDDSRSFAVYLTEYFTEILDEGRRYLCQSINNSRIVVHTYESKRSNCESLVLPFLNIDTTFSYFKRHRKTLYTLSGNAQIIATGTLSLSLHSRTI